MRKMTAMLCTCLGIFVVSATIRPFSEGICTSDAWANTLNDFVFIPGDGQFRFSGLSLTVLKQCGPNQSALLYTCQITCQIDGSLFPAGVQYEMRVRNIRGEYIMPAMRTGTVIRDPNAYHNLVLTDTVFSIPTQSGEKQDPDPGEYVFELWAMAGQGTLLTVPFMSNIAAVEIPRRGA